MDDEEFEECLIRSLEMPGEGDLYPHHANPYPEDLRDARFDALCALYLQANEEQRTQIPAILACEESTRAYSLRR